ncbi:MAG: hypothetical protein OXN25_17785 [Candidatus Poribacteria bacterium]|nr:hypothetical protein [Candidatus Poribacteria bacterium]
MSIRPFVFVLCLLLCVCSFFGIYRLQAQPQPQETQPPAAEVSETKSDVGSASDPKSDVPSDFTQTIIRNNLFAPLGTDLHSKARPGANLTLLGTFLRQDPTDSKVLIKNETTGRQHVLAIGDVLGGFSVSEIQPKQVTLSENGNTVILRLPQDVLLN